MTEAELGYRQTRVLKLLYEGHSNEGIAKIEGISPRTVECVIAELAKKLAPESRNRKEFNIRSRVVFRAIEAKLI